MSFMKGLLLCISVISLCFSASCAPNHIYRSEFKLCNVSPENPCDKFSLQQHNKDTNKAYLLTFVEVDDQGQLRDRHQMMAVIDALYKTAHKESLLINVFVHGWHHNAAPDDSNVASFMRSLARLSEIEDDLSSRQNRPKRKIVGVYVGWRGESITVPVVNNLTFWERKNTAQEVGHFGVTELFLRLEEISNVRNTLEPPIKSRLVVIGHSFGGAVVYSAAAQILASRFVDSREEKNFTDTAKGFGDLVVLINPAFEALRYTPLYDLAQSRCSYFDNQRPKLAILTSEADKATKYSFPAGRVFSTIFEKHNDIEREDCDFPLALNEWKADITSVGHYTPIVTHTLTTTKDETPKLVARIDNIGKIWASQEKGDTTQFGTTVLTHLGNTVPRNPYLNIKVSKELIADHNDIFGNDVMAFLRILILLSTWE